MATSKTKAFEQAVKNHDLTYMYSDDGAAYRRGSDSFDKIQTLAKEMPVETVKRIWDAKVDSVLAEGYREQFYWKV